MKSIKQSFTGLLIILSTFMASGARELHAIEQYSALSDSLVSAESNNETKSKEYTGGLPFSKKQVSLSLPEELFEWMIAEQIQGTYGANTENATQVELSELKVEIIEGGALVNFDYALSVQSCPDILGSRCTPVISNKGTGDMRLALTVENWQAFLAIDQSYDSTLTSSYRALNAFLNTGFGGKIQNLIYGEINRRLEKKTDSFSLKDLIVTEFNQLDLKPAQAMILKSLVNSSQKVDVDIRFHDSSVEVVLQY